MLGLAWLWPGLAWASMPGLAWPGLGWPDLPTTIPCLACLLAGVLAAVLYFLPALLPLVACLLACLLALGLMARAARDNEQCKATHIRNLSNLAQFHMHI